MQNKGMFLEGIFRELLNISLTENNLQLLTVDLRAYLFSPSKIIILQSIAQAPMIQTNEVSKLSILY